MINGGTLDAGSNDGDGNGNNECKLGQEVLIRLGEKRNDSGNAAVAASSTTSPASARSDMQGVISSRGQGSTSVGGRETERSGIVSRIGDYVGKLGFGKSGRIDENPEDKEVDKETDDVQEHQMKVMFREQRPMPFELAILEAMLHEVSEKQGDRVTFVFIFSPFLGGEGGRGRGGAIDLHCILQSSVH